MHPGRETQINGCVCNWIRIRLHFSSIIEMLNKSYPQYEMKCRNMFRVSVCIKREDSDSESHRGVWKVICMGVIAVLYKHAHSYIMNVLKPFGGWSFQPWIQAEEMDYGITDGKTATIILALIRKDYRVPCVDPATPHTCKQPHERMGRFAILGNQCLHLVWPCPVLMRLHLPGKRRGCAIGTAPEISVLVLQYLFAPLGGASLSMSGSGCHSGNQSLQTAWPPSR